VPNLVGVFRECDALKFTFTSLVEQAQLDFGRVSREEGEVCALAVPCCATRMRQTLLYHAFSSCLHEFSFSLQVLSGFRKFKATARSSQSGDGKDSGLWRIQHNQVITQGDAPLKPPGLLERQFLFLLMIRVSAILPISKLATLDISDGNLRQFRDCCRKNCRVEQEQEAPPRSSTKAMGYTM
jgi:hypothetical protein